MFGFLDYVAPFYGRMLLLHSCGQDCSRCNGILPLSQIIRKEVKMNREHSGISPKRHQIQVPQIESMLAGV